MYNILKNSHNGIGMVLLFLLLTIIIFILVRFLQNKTYSESVRTLALIGMITIHIQLLVGFLVYFLSPLGLSNFSGESMSHTISRFYIIEHPVGMILAAFLITRGFKMSKSSSLSDKSKFARLLIYYTAGFGVIAYLIPWFLWV